MADTGEKVVQGTESWPMSRLLGFALQEEPVDLLDSSQQEDATLEPVDLLDSSQEEAYTLGSVPEEPGTASHELFFSCAICLEEHSMEDCYIARMCGHRMCRDAAREVVLGAVRCAPTLGVSSFWCTLVATSYGVPACLHLLSTRCFKPFLQSPAICTTFNTV